MIWSICSSHTAQSSHSRFLLCLGVVKLVLVMEKNKQTNKPERLEQDGLQGLFQPFCNSMKSCQKKPAPVNLNCDLWAWLSCLVMFLLTCAPWSCVEIRIQDFWASYLNFGPSFRKNFRNSIWELFCFFQLAFVTLEIQVSKPKTDFLAWYWDLPYPHFSKTQRRLVLAKSAGNQWLGQFTETTSNAESVCVYTWSVHHILVEMSQCAASFTKSKTNLTQDSDVGQDLCSMLCETGILCSYSPDLLGLSWKYLQEHFQEPQWWVRNMNSVPELSL